MVTGKCNLFYYVAFKPITIWLWRYPAKFWGIDRKPGVTIIDMGRITLDIRHN